MTHAVLNRYGLDLTSLSRPGGISDRRMSLGLLRGLSRTQLHDEESLVLALYGDEPSWLFPTDWVKGAVDVAIARPRSRGVWNSFSFRNITASFAESDAFTYFHFPPIGSQHTCLTYVPDIIPLRFRSAVPRYMTPYYEMQRLMIRRLGSSVVTLSHAERQELLTAGYADEPDVYVIRPGLLLPLTDDSGSQCRTVCTRVPGLASGTAEEFCFVPGRLTMRKNVEGVLEAWRLLGDDAPLLVLAGPCEDRRILEQIERSLGVVYLSEVSEQILENLYKQSLLVIQASVAEGFGLPVGEALVRQKPVAASAIPSFEEITSHMTQGVAHFDPRQPEDIAAAVRRSLDGPQVLASEAEALALHYSWENCAADLIAAMRNASRMGYAS